MIGLPPKIAGFDVIRPKRSVSLLVLSTTYLPSHGTSVPISGSPRWWPSAEWVEAEILASERRFCAGSVGLWAVRRYDDPVVYRAGGTRIQVRINGVDVFQPTTGEVRSDGADGIACWFIDTDYNEESFFVRPPKRWPVAVRAIRSISTTDRKEQGP